MISPEDTYPGRTVPASASYPEGAVQNETVPDSSDDGTPLDDLWGNDLEGLKQAIARSASIVPTVPGNIPDTATSSQILHGLIEIASGRAISYDDSGVADAYVASLKTNQQGVADYFVDMVVELVVTNDGTGGATTIDVEGTSGTLLGVKNIKTLAGGDPLADDITGRLKLRYDGIDFIILPFEGGVVAAPSLRGEQIDLIAGVLRQQVGVAVTMTAVGTLATVTHVAHGYTTGRYINGKGANEADYNGYFQITVTGVDTYTFVMAGSPASPATGTITARSPEQYDWIVNHVNTGVDSSESIIVTSPYQLTIPFAKTYSKVISIVAGPDEEMAGRFGMSVGASVSSAAFTLKMAISRTLAVGIYYGSGVWNTDYGFNQGGTEAGQVNITNMTYDGTRLIITHDAMLGDNIQVSPKHIVGVTVANIPVIESRTTTETKIRFINPSTGTYAGAANANMSFQLSYNYHSDYPWSGSSGDADALEFEDGNIWFLGAMQV